MAGSLFTIGIPTFNRAAFLPRAIECALGQSHREVEVIVSDNASTDQTEKIARSYGSRVRYHRNDSNIGPWNNFARLADLANGDSFSWLQDDCLIHRDFVSRAVIALNQAPEVHVYAAYLAAASGVGGDRQTLFYPRVYGPPVGAAWMNGGGRLIEGRLVPLFSFFVNFAAPPALAFRTAAARAGVSRLLLNCLIYNERILLTHAADGGQIVVDPWIAGIYQLHPGQVSGSVTVEEWVSQWETMTLSLGNHLQAQGDTRWRPLFAELLAEMSEADRRLLYDNPDKHTPPGLLWGAIHPVAGQIHRMLWDSLAPEFRSQVERDHPTSGRARIKKSLARVGEALTPPLIWRAIERLRR